MYRHILLFCILAFLIKEGLSIPVAGCNGLRTPTIATGSAFTSVGGCGGIPVQTTVPLVTEILPALQFGDVNLAGDIPIGGSIKVTGSFPVYGVVSVDGAVPSAGTAVINTGGAFVCEPGCRY